jgi:phage terminase small subunit
LVEWSRISGELSQRGALSIRCRPALIAYCGAYDLWTRAEQALRHVAPGGDEARVLNEIASAAAADCGQYAELLGLTPFGGN